MDSGKGNNIIIKGGAGWWGSAVSSMWEPPNRGIKGAGSLWVAGVQAIEGDNSRNGLLGEGGKAKVVIAGIKGEESCAG